MTFLITLRSEKPGISRRGRPRRASTCWSRYARASDTFQWVLSVYPAHSPIVIRSLMQVEIGQNLNRYSIDVDMLARIAAVAPHITCLVCFYFDGQQSHNPKRWRSRPPSPDMVGGPSSSIPEARRLESFTFVHLAELKLWVSNRKPEALARLLGA